MKKFMAIDLSISMLVAFCACGKSGNDSESLNINLDKNIKATLSVAFENDKSEETTVIAAEEAFKKNYPNVTFDNVKITGYQSALMGDIASGISYDVLWVADEVVTVFAQNNVLENLDPYMQASGFDSSLYYEAMMKLGQINHNGSQYFLPRDYDKIVCYLNKAMFKELNVEIPENGWTWDDYLQTCAQLKTAIAASDETTRYAMEAELVWRIQMYGITSSFGGTFLNSEGEPIFDEAFQNGLKALYGLVENDYCKYTTGKQYSDFISGKVAMRWQVRPSLSTYEAVLGDDLDVVSFPVIGDRPKVGTGTTGYGIGKTSEQKNLAWAFISFMMGEEGETAMSKVGGIVPSLKSLAEDGNADWRKQYPNINNEAFVYSGTGDVIPDYYDSLTSIYASAYEASVYKMIDNVLNGKLVTNSVNTCKYEISEFIKQRG